MKRISKEPWFAKEAGWGLRPVSWLGGFTSVIFVLSIVGLLLLTYFNPQYVWQFEFVVVIIIISFIIITALTRDKNTPEK